MARWCLLDKFYNSIIILLTLLVYSLVLPQFASASPPSYRWHEIHNAVRAGDLKKVKDILDKDPKEIDAQLEVSHWSSGTREADVTPLSVAAAEGNLEMVKLLLERGARVDTGMNEFPSAYPLHEAAINGNVQVARLLLEKGAKVNALGNVRQVPGAWGSWAGVTALHLASACGHFGMVQLLLEHGATVNACAKNGDTSLHAAARRGDLALAQLLVSLGADPTIKNAEGKTAADEAKNIEIRFPSRQKTYEEVVIFLTDIEHAPPTKEARDTLLQKVEHNIKTETTPHFQMDDLLAACGTTTDRNDFIFQTRKLLKAKDTRVLDVIDSRLNDFDSFVIMDITPLIYELDSPETRSLAKKWLTRPFPKNPGSIKVLETKRKAYELWDSEVGIRFWSSLILLKGSSADQELAVRELDKLFDNIGLREDSTTSIDVNDSPYALSQNLQFKVRELSKVNRKDVHEIACRLSWLPDLNWDNLQATKILFNAGCPGALNTLTVGLCSAPDGPANVMGSGDYLVAALSNLSQDWIPAGFIYEATQPAEIRKQKRKELAQWLEKKFREIKEGRSLPLSVNSPHP